MYKDKERFYEADLVYLFAPLTPSLQMDTTKLRQDFIGLLVVGSTLESTHYKLRDPSDQVL